MLATTELEVLEYGNRLAENHGWPIHVSFGAAAPALVFDDQRKLVRFAERIVAVARWRGLRGVHMTLGRR